MIIEYPLYFLSDDEFEHLVADLCASLLGIGTVRFSKGRDGGKDGRFEGTAQRFPSSTSPWSGKFIIQSKHTKKLDASCSDYDFDQKIIPDEIQRLKKLIAEEGVDNYLVFTNRKVSGGKDSTIISNIKSDTAITNVQLIGKETLNSYLHNAKAIVSRYHLDSLLEPLRFYDSDLRDIVLSFAAGFKKIDPTNLPDLSFVNLEEKNRLNQLSEHYFEIMKSNSLSYFDSIKLFLADPKNEELREAYENTVYELQNKIIAGRTKWAEFEHIFIYLYDYLIEKNQDLKARRKLVMVFLHYMYCNCDIGRKHAPSQ